MASSWKKCVDLSGKCFGRFTVIERDRDRTNKSNNWKTYWKCKCNCGNIRSVESKNLVHNTSRSCGCLQKEKARENGKKFKLPNGETPKRNVYASYKRRAKLLEFEFELDIDTFYKMSQLPCFYCGMLLSNIRINQKDKTDCFQYNGIDRIDSNKGYVDGNIVPCCEICNKAKRDLSLTDFYNWVRILYKNLKDTNQL